MFSNTVQNTTKITLTIIAILATGWFVIAAREILFTLFIAFIVSSALLPIVDTVSKRGIPRWITALLVYLLLGCLSVVVLWGFTPLVTDQAQRFFTSLPEIYEQTVEMLQLHVLLQGFDFQLFLSDVLRTFSDQVLTTPASVLNFVFEVFGQFANLILLVIFSYYLVVEHDKIEEHVLIIFEKKSRKKMRDVLERAERKLGAWLRGQLVVMLIVGTLTTIGLVLLQVKFAVSLGIIAGVFEIIPLFGPFIAIVPALMVALTQSTWHAVGVIILYFIIQQIGGAVITPKVMNKAVGIDPFVVLLAIVIGGTLAGTAGVIVAIPTVAVIGIFWDEITKQRS